MPPEVPARTFCLLKPDAVERGLVGAALAMIEPAFDVRRLELIVPSPAQVAIHYQWHVDKPYYRDLYAFMRSGPVVAVVLAARHEGADAVVQLRTLTGSYRRVDAGPGTVRGRFMVDGDPVYRNLIHGSDSYAEARREAFIWFRFPDGDFGDC